MLIPKFSDRDYGLWVIATLLALSFTLPSPALALRIETSKEAGVEEQLQLALTPAPSSAVSAAGVEEFGWRESRWVRVAGALLVGATMFGGLWMLPRNADLSKNDPLVKKELPRTDLQRKVTPGSGLYFWETGPVTQKEMADYLPHLLNYVRQNKIRKVYMDIPLTDEEKTVSVDQKIILDFPGFEKRVEHWRPFLSGLRKEGVQVWLTYTASWWPKADPEYDRLDPSERPSKKLAYDPKSFKEDPPYAVRYDLEYALPVHTRFHLNMLGRVVGSKTVRDLFGGVYVHLEPRWTVGWAYRAPDSHLDRRYLEMYLKFLENTYQVTTRAGMPLMVNSWQEALPMPAGLYEKRPPSPPLLWKGQPLLKAVQARADIVNVWLQWVEPSVTAVHLNQILSEQDPAIPLEITLEFADDPQNPQARNFSPDRLWRIVRDVGERWEKQPFSVTLRGFNPGATAAPDFPRGNKAGAEEKFLDRRSFLGAAAGAVGGGFLGRWLGGRIAGGLIEPLPGKIMGAGPEGPIQEQIREWTKKAGIPLKQGGNGPDWAAEGHRLVIGQPQPIPEQAGERFVVYSRGSEDWGRFEVPAGVNHAIFLVPLSRKDGEELTTRRFDLLSILLTIGDLSNVGRYRLTVDTERASQDPRLGVLTGPPEALFPGTNSFDIPLVSDVRENHGAIRGIHVELWPRDRAEPMNFGFRSSVIRSLPYAKAQAQQWSGGILGILPGAALGFEIGRRVAKRISRPSPSTPAAGLEERVPEWLKPALGEGWMEVVYGVHEMAQVADKIAVLLQPELLGVAGDDGETQDALMSLGENLHGAFGWRDETSLQLGLLTLESVKAFEGDGYHVIRVVRYLESEQTPLPWEAVPIVVAQALAGAQPTFWVNVTPYLNLKGITLPEILSTLTDLFA